MEVQREERWEEEEGHWRGSERQSKGKREGRKKGKYEGRKKNMKEGRKEISNPFNPKS